MAVAADEARDKAEGIGSECPARVSHEGLENTLLTFLFFLSCCLIHPCRRRRGGVEAADVGMAMGKSMATVFLFKTTLKDRCGGQWRQECIVAVMPQYQLWPAAPLQYCGEPNAPLQVAPGYWQVTACTPFASA